MSDILKDITQALGAGFISNRQPSSTPGRPVTVLDEIDVALNKRYDKPGKKFKVTNVIDGDTLDLEGFGRVRLAGINTSETVDPRKGVQAGGPEASAFLKKLAGGRDVTVKLQAGDARDKYGRHLAAIEDEDGRVFNVEMINAGHTKQIKEIPQSAPVADPEVGRLWRSASAAMRNGLSRGLLYPVSSFFTEEWKALQRTGDRARRDLLQELDSRGMYDGNVRDKVAMAPEIVGELIGGLPANVLTYGTFRGALGVGQAATMAGKAARSIVAAGASASSISALAYLDDGQSRAMRLARDFAIGGAFELIGIPLVRKAWREEITQKVADNAISKIAQELGAKPEAVASHIDALRTGNVGANLHVATKLSEELGKNATAAKSVLKLNADRAIADWYSEVIPTNVTADPALFLADKNFGVYGHLALRNPATGENSVRPFHIRSMSGDKPAQVGKESTTKFAKEVRQLQKAALEYRKAGFEVKLDGIKFGGEGAWTRFTNLFRGIETRPPSDGARKGTFAARSERPAPGKIVRDSVTGKEVTVLNPEEPDWDLFEGMEVRSLLKNAPGRELSQAAAIARAEGDSGLTRTVVSEIDARIAAYAKNLDAITGQSDKGLVELDTLMAQANKQAPGYVAVRARLTNEMTTRNVKRVQPSSQPPKGIQGPLTKFEEGIGDGIEAQASGTRSNEWGVAGYHRREGSNQLVTFMRKAKAGVGKARDVRQGVRDEARRIRDEWAALRNEDHARVARSAESLEAERASLAQQVSEGEMLPVPEGMPGFQPDRWTVKVRDDRGTVQTRTLDQLTPIMNIASPGFVPRPLGLKPHSDGSVRHGLVDLQNGKVVTEDFDRPSEFWRSPEATEISEEDYLVGHTPRVFMHEEGITLSIPNTQNFDALRGDWRVEQRIPKVHGKVEDVGPIDTIAAYQHAPRVYTSTGKEWQNTELGMKRVTTGEEVRGRQVIRQSRTPVRYYEPETQSWKIRERSEHDFYETFAGKPDTVEGQRTFSAGFTPRKAAPEGQPGEYNVRMPPRVLERLPSELFAEDIVVRPPSFAIAKEGAEAHLELVTAKRAAKVLINEGADPNTPVRLTVSGSNFDVVDKQFEWTLSELASQKFPPARWDTVREVANSRGFSVIPNGAEVRLRSQAGEYTFPSGTEALEFLLRVPQGKKYSPIIERKLLQQWAVGGPERESDAVVDGLRFRETPLQESSITEVVMGRSPATLVQSTHGRMMNGTVNALTKQNGARGTFGVVDLDGELTDKAHEARRFVVYEQNAVRARINAHQVALQKVGIDPRANEDAVIRALAQYGRGSGLHFLFGNRDPGDALLYAQLRQWNQPELFRQGKVEYDTHGAFRSFGSELRRQLGKQLQEAPPNPIYDPALESRLPNRQGGFQAAPRRFQDLFAPPDSGGSGGGRTPFDSLAPIGAGGGDVRPPIAELSSAAEEEYLSSSRTFRLSDFFRVPMELFKEYQEATGIPFYHWWQTIDHGRTQVVRVTHPVINNIHRMTHVVKREERIQVGQLFELRYSDEAAFQRVRDAAPEIVQKTEGLLDGIMRKYVADLGLDPDVELKQLPFFRKVNIDSREMRPYDTNRPPNPITRKSKGFSDNLPLDEREYDFAITMKRYARALAHEKHLATEWAEIDKAMGRLHGMEGDTSVKYMIDFFNRHRAEAVHAQDRLGYGLAMGVRNVTKRLTGSELSMDEAMDVVGTLTGANYFANMGFNLGMTVRNYLQVLQTVFPVMGGQDTMFGVRMALRWRKDPALREAMQKRDIVTTNAFMEPLSNIQQAVLETDALSKYAKGTSKVLNFMNKGVAFYQSADDFNRVASYYAQFNAAERAGKRFLAKKTSWAEYLVESKAEFRDAGTSLLGDVKEALARGDNELASHMLARDFTKSAQFDYTRGNVPYVMQSTAGRLFGQYGTWPAWYTEWLGNHALRRGSRSSRLQFAARWAAVNATMFYGMAEVFGVDFGRWSFFAPLVYTGGPMAQVGQQTLSALSAKVSGGEDAVSRIQAARLQTSAWKQFLPFPTVQTSHTIEAGRQLTDGNWPEALKMLLGLPEAKP